MEKLLSKIIIGAALFGFSDSLYLAIRHFRQVPGVCVLGGNCNEVLASVYATVGGIPLAILGLVYYLIILISFFYYLKIQKKIILKLINLWVAAGILIYFYLVYLQIAVIEALCFYCILSAVASVIIGALTLVLLQLGNRAKIFPKA